MQICRVVVFCSPRAAGFSLEKQVELLLPFVNREVSRGKQTRQARSSFSLLVLMWFPPGVRFIFTVARRENLGHVQFTRIIVYARKLRECRLPEEQSVLLLFLKCVLLKRWGSSNIEVMVVICCGYTRQVSPMFSNSVWSLFSRLSHDLLHRVSLLRQ